MMKKGLLLVFTGDGKGKTTAAAGMALRTLGHGLRVCVIQFIKGGRPSGEIAALSRFSDLADVHVMGRGFTWTSDDPEKDRKAARKAWRLAREILGAGTCHLLVLDELTYLMKYEMVDAGEIIQALEARQKGLHVVVTGRGAPEALVAAADLVTEMKVLKHPFADGVRAQKGVEF
jgi:cob(I)alamin adenosyltransferase